MALVAFQKVDHKAGPLFEPPASTLEKMVGSPNKHSVRCAESMDLEAIKIIAIYLKKY